MLLEMSLFPDDMELAVRILLTWEVAVACIVGYSLRLGFCAILFNVCQTWEGDLRPKSFSMGELCMCLLCRVLQDPGHQASDARLRTERLRSW